MRSACMRGMMAMPVPAVVMMVVPVRTDMMFMRRMLRVGLRGACKRKRQRQQHRYGK
jgi:hypothetical protein